MAFPGLTPFAAMAFAVPVAGATTLALVIAVVELYWRGRSTGRPELLKWRPEAPSGPDRTEGLLRRQPNRDSVISSKQ